MPQSSSIQALRSLVRLGFYVHNLRRMEQKSEELLLSGEHPVVFYVLQSMFSDLRMSWEDYPLAATENREVQETLTVPIDDLLAMILAEAPEEAISEQLGRIITEFIHVRSVAGGKGHP